MKKQNLFLCLTLLIFSTLHGQDNTRKNLLELKNRFYSEDQQNRAAVKAYCKRTGKPESWTSGEKVFQIQKLDANGKPVVMQTESNVEAANSTGASAAWTGGSLGLNLNGQGMIIGEWDGGAVLNSHQEFTSNRVTQIDGATTVSSHATHVAGTLIGNGTSASAKGMMHQGSLWAHDWNNDQSEMAAAAINGLRISNHSYGWLTGWHYNGSQWFWYGDATVNTTTDNLFGFYNSTAQQWDQVAFNAPNYLIVKSAGNDRGQGPAAGTSHQVWNGTSWVASTAIRDKDGGTAGYDCMSYSSVSKNILTVGAVNRIAAGYSGPSSVVMSSFSSWGPTDDGRIKPDIVGAGVSLLSAYTPNSNSYASLSGTSMAGPNVAGSLGLVQQHAQNVRGSMLLGATLKGLAIHTAHEAGTADGPDYTYGWGLLNVAGCINTINSTQTSSGILENTLSQGASFEIKVYNDGLTPLQATISWYDPAGPVNASNSFNDRTARLVNDLDLRITRVSDGNNEFPWILNPDAPSAAATKADNIKDNVEKVAILSPAAGFYTIRVTHKGTLNGNQQNYSLIYSGVQNCANLTQFPASFSAPIKASGPYTIANNQFQSHYNQMTGVSAGNTFQSTASIAGTWITVRAGSSTGTVVAQGSTPLNWTAAAGGTYFIHYNTNSVCGSANINMTSTVENTSPPDNDACAGATILPALPYTSPVVFNTGATDDFTISTCSGPNKNLWWKVTGICGTLTASTCGASFDTKLAVFTGSCGTFTQVACNDNNGPACSSNAASVSWAASAGTVYYISAGSSLINSPTGSMQLSVSVTPLATPVISGALSFCFGSSTTLDAGAGYSSYLWSNGATTRTITVSTAGTYSVTVTNENGCTAQSAASEVVVKEISVSVQEATACLSYQWNNITYTNSGTYSYQTTNAAGCDSTATLVLTVLKLPAITPNFTGPTGVCRSKTGLVYSIPASAGATSYTWILPAGLTGSSNTNSITVASSSTFAGGNIQVKANNSCGSSPFAQLAVTAVTALPAAPASITGPASVCAGSSQTYVCSDVTGATYTWTAPANATLTDGQGTNTATFLFNATYTTGAVSVKSTNCFGTSTTARTLTVAKKSLPGTPGVITGITAGVCSTVSRTYSIVALANTDSYQWTAPSGATISSGQGTTSVVVQFAAGFTTEA
jgi:hypothetical protein